MEQNCDNSITYIKTDPAEIVEAGDVIMLDPRTGYVRKAVQEREDICKINNSLVIGICVASDNESNLNIVLDGGSAKEKDRETVSGGLSNFYEEDESETEDNTDEEQPEQEVVETILLDSGTSEISPRQKIQVAYTGLQIVNICGPVHIGDRLCVSRIPGKAQTKDFLGRDYYEMRSIGKVIGLSKDRKQARVLLDIE